MPTYCYRATENSKGCDYCKETFEVKQHMDEEALKTFLYKKGYMQETINVIP